MKKLKVRFLVLTFILVLLLFLFDSVKTFAATDVLEIETTANKQSYDLQDEILVKIKTNKKVMTASFYLNYDSSIISYEGFKTGSVATKDYPQDNLVRVVYADMSGSGTDEIILAFKLKNKDKQNVQFNLSNLTMTTTSEKKTYKQNEINGADSVLNITINTDQEVQPTPTPKNEQQTNQKDTKEEIQVSDKKLPKTGEKYIEVIILVVSCLFTTIIGIKYLTYKKIN